MKKVLILSIAVLVFASCGKNGYDTLTRNSNNNNTSPATTSTDPAAKFNTLWVAESTSVTVTTDQKRDIANFFGYNTAHYAFVFVQAGYNCPFGYYDANYLHGSCYGGSDFLRNYFYPSSSSVGLFPAPMDIGGVSSYRIRFAADVDEATRRVVPASAYLQVVVNASSDALSREFTTMSSSVTVTDVIYSGSDCQKIKASWTDGCGSVSFHAYLCDGAAALIDPYVTFKQTKESYKKASCYYDGHLPVDATEIEMNDEITSAMPVGVTPSTDDAGKVKFISDSAAPLVDLIEQ